MEEVVMDPNPNRSGTAEVTMNVSDIMDKIAAAALAEDEDGLGEGTLEDEESAQDALEGT